MTDSLGPKPSSVEPAAELQAPLLEPERSKLLTEALTDARLQAVKTQLERRGLSINAEEAQAIRLAGGEQLLIPFGESAHLVWLRTKGQVVALGLVRQGERTLNITASGEERLVRSLSSQQGQHLLGRVGARFPEGVRRVRGLLDESRGVAILGVEVEGREGMAYQVRVKVEGWLEPSGEPLIEKLEPSAAPPAEGEVVGGYEGPQICISQWGYIYDCRKITPILQVNTTSLSMPFAIIPQQRQASFIVWNYGGGTLRGTVTVSAPFSIVSGASFSLAPGQPQEVVVRFSSATPGSFSRSISISSNGGNKTVTATGVAHKVSFSPAQVDFGSGLLVMREQCSERMGQQFCGPVTEKVGLPIEKSLTVKNEGSVAVSLTLSTAAPYKIVSVLPTLAPGQSGQVTVRFEPNESGTFTENVQVGLQNGQGSVTSSPLTGVAHKIEIEPAELDFGVVFIGMSRREKLTVKNQGVTTVALDISVAAPFNIISGGSVSLVPGESHELTVWANPVAPGSLSANVKLANGSNHVNVPTKALAYIFAEYVQQFLNSYNSLVQQPKRWGLLGYQADESPERVLLLAGFQGITASQLEEEYQQFSQPVSPAVPSSNEPLDPERAKIILQSLGWQQIGNWLQQLARAVQQGDFQDVYQGLISQEPAFLQFLEALRLMLPAESATLEMVREYLREFVEGRDFSQWLSLEQFQDYWSLEFYLRGIFEFYFKHILGLSKAEAQERANSRVKEFIQHFDAALAVIRAFSKEFQLPWAGDPATEMKSSIYGIIRSMWHKVATYGARSVPLVDQLEGILKWFENLQFPLSPKDVDHARELLAAVNAANAFLNEGQPYFSQVILTNIFGITPEGQLTGDPIGVDLQGILTLDITNRVIMDAKIKLRFNDCSGCEVAKDQIITAIKSLVDSLDGCKCGIVGYVFTDPMGASTSLINKIANEFYYFDGALFLVWWENGQLKFTCVGSMCNEMSSTMRRKIACMMAGRRGLCNAQEVITYYVYYVALFYEVIVIPIPYVNP